MNDRVPDETSLAELTLRGMILGALITIVFTAANVYLGLKIGLTFASSIPAAVISMAALKMFKTSNILENNMVQTQASAAGTLSSIIFVIPGLVMIGRWQGFPYWQVFGLSALGGILGVLFTIPLRRAMVVESDLVYPEGVAGAEILRAGAEPGGVTNIVIGAVASGLVCLFSTGFHLLAEDAAWFFRIGTPVFRIGTSFSLALLGAGFLVGILGGGAMLLGLFIAWGVAVPILTTLHPIPEGADIATAATAVWRSDVRFMGAGTIAVGAIWTLLALSKPVLGGVRSSLAALAEQRAGRGHLIPRTERDIPINIVVLIAAALTVPLAGLFGAFVVGTDLDIGSGATIGLVTLGVLFTLVFGFAIAAACGYMAGLVGSTNSPISGIGILSTIFMSLLLVAFFGGAGGVGGLAGGTDFLVAFTIFVASAVLASATIANDNLQDLKTGWLLGATPWRQQVALVIGVIAGAVVIPPVLNLLYQAYGFADAMPRPGMPIEHALAAPQATLMKAIAVGIVSHQMRWTMIIIGIALGAALLLIDAALSRSSSKLRLPTLGIGIGIYLPPDVTAPICVGALIAWVIERRLQRAEHKNGLDAGALTEPARKRGTLLASGMIVGESLVGIALAALIVFSGNAEPLSLVSDNFITVRNWLAAVTFTLVCIELGRRAMSRT